MIITRTPFRVSFIGGGSDLKEFYSRNGYGAVVSCSINKYMYIVIHPYFHDKIRLKYSKTEDVKTIDEIQHPIVRECLKKVHVGGGVEIASFADIPAGTGLGSSSAFTVGLLNALYAYRGVAVTKERLAREACEIEIEILKEPIGKQDQYASTYGNINYIKFYRDESVDVSPILISEDNRIKLEKNLSLFYVGGQRRSRDILGKQSKNISCDTVFNKIKEMVTLTDRVRDILLNGSIDDIGPLLHDGWTYKRGLADEVSNSMIDLLYENALQNGASGGKLLGAGQTGFLLLYSKEQERLKSVLNNRNLPFKIDREGTKIIYYE